MKSVLSIMLALVLVIGMATAGCPEVLDPDGPDWSHRPTPPTPGLDPPSDEAGFPSLYESVDEYREYLLEGPYGQMPVDQLLDMALATLDPTRYEMNLTLLLRKGETLPLLRNRLSTDGDDDEKYDLLMLIQDQLRWDDLTPEIRTLLSARGRCDLVRGRAATALALFDEATEKDIEAIQGLLQTAADVQARQWAAMALGVLGDTGSILLVEDHLLGHESDFVRLTGAMVLGMLGSTAGEQVALGLSSHERFDVRCRAAEALSYIGTSEAMARLQQMEQHDPSPTVRSQSFEFRGRAELESLDRSAALAELQRLLSPVSQGIGKVPHNPPAWAFIYLAEYFAPEAQAFLQELADSPGPLRHPAWVALLELENDFHMIRYQQRPQRPRSITPFGGGVSPAVEGPPPEHDSLPDLIATLHEGRT